MSVEHQIGEDRYQGLPCPLAPVRNDLFDEFRVVAAVGVLLYNVGVTYQSPNLVSGYLRVDLFFLLGGFVISNAYGDRLRNYQEAAVTQR
jgi:peptidoglycan/LPS O-acetylase OafA/YrhL